MEARSKPPVLTAGGRCSLPVLTLLLLGFVAPLVAVIAFSFAEPRSFAAFSSFTLANYREIFDPANTVWMSFAWSLGLAGVTVALLGVITYPIALGLVRVFGRWAPVISILFVFPLFISENVRLYGWVLFFIKNGVLDGTLRLLGGSGPEVLYTPAATLFGMVYTYLPFMLFPTVLGLSLLPRDVVDAARDLGASRLQAWWEVELPLAMPGILIGTLLTFVLAVGAVAESKIMGGQSLIVITHDIEIAFTYSQNWPLGSALAVLLTLIIGGLTLFALSKLDLDRILGRK
ncbi:ABC transporter permease [Rhodospirillum rubrum]|uniref:Binding-protein-dependent transport systems inner membrane component n=1 Tax=Rhodospirillum rubrum (strain ATCC 11170 / ATH 1.1.1 / DSM 467 / LMG 4362 / NCIMB 8255 / S1) TaxID=269796 RepID=Q2RPY7_RHORT|nr:ABC transporter permease [Rhodospirillum rubrum]ABC23808.1 Binding-protein-dependent transport systems inner membrane component [Rhodospirillum rubrum ATCC 11170]AEO49548.1 binding-protein dependent transport system inner membrane protein [Rhodospirillum rubrum F11]MBK5955484.1 spermidine/putrescine ABC transporter permease [Rhodospirillum rubrum]QXG79755.1 ABC transporter permease [Rhodospirillum rubrum]HAP98793.1 ABC transporter permease [Rhodospirillum rubrum]